MNRKKRIETAIKNSFIDWEFEVVDQSNKHIGHNNYDGTQESHFLLILKKKNIQNKVRLSLHRKVNEVLKQEFSNGLHALEIKIIN